jgi:hypothetical protein
MTGTYPKCEINKFKSSEDFKTCVEGVVDELNAFNFLSESNEAREVLYNVCKYNFSVHFKRD